MAKRLTQSQWDAKRAKAKANALKALKNSPVETAAPIAADLGSYSGLTKDELVEELKARELPHTGNKEELITRLEEDDEVASQNED